MKRLWLGITLAAILLVMGFGVTDLIDRTSADIAGTLESAAAEALSGNLQTAATLAQNAHTQWKRAWNRVAVVADHAPMDEIDGLFAQLSVYANTGSSTAFAAHCRRIAQLILAMGEAHSFTWWNLL